MTDINVYQQTTTVEINDLTITGTDGRTWSLKGMFLTVTIFEDIFAAFTNGSVILSDAQDYINRIPIDNGQLLTIQFRSNTANNFVYWNKTFVITRIDGITRAANAGQSRSYRLSFISAPMQNHLNNRISRAYTTMTESDIVRDICTNIFKIPANKLNIEPSKYISNFVVPNWKPLDLIRHCCSTAVRGTGYESTNYLFYEDLMKWNFVSFDYLMAQTVLPEAITNAITTQLDKTKAQAPLRQATKLEGKNHSDLLMNSETGMFGTRMLGIDIFSKQYQSFDWVYDNEFQNLPMIDSNGNGKVTDNPPTNPYQKLIVAPWQSAPRGYSSDHNDKHVHKRHGMMAIWNNISYDATITGDTSLLVGQKVNLNLTQSNAFEANNTMDNSMSGAYIITAIRHDFDNAKHSQVLNLRKGSWKNS